MQSPEGATQFPRKSMRLGLHASLMYLALQGNEHCQKVENYRIRVIPRKSPNLAANYTIKIRFMKNTYPKDSGENAKKDENKGIEEQDETAFLMNNPINKAMLLKAVEQDKNGEFIPFSLPDA
jgi:hypothetical protein